MGRSGKARQRIGRLGDKLAGSRKKQALWFVLALLLLIFCYSLPDPLFDDPTCTLLEDHQGELLSARIAGDGQWRFPLNTQVPHKFEEALLEFEDQYFYRHPGVNPFSLLRALKDNIRAGQVVSGGSTLTMQLIRLSRKGKPRNLYQKLVEMILAVRAEFRYSKQEILALYASHAPFGGNVVGLDAAAWRYYGRPPGHLSWAETAALAVLPNAPSLIYPGRHQELFRKKRDRLLKDLHQEAVIDSTIYRLALEEPLPGQPASLPQEAPHLLNHALEKGLRGKRIATTIDRSLQQKATRIVGQHHRLLQYNEIHNAAALILDVETGEALAYVGNTSDPRNRHENRVNVITAPRSSGSILKPLLFASMLDEGSLLPNTLVADIPTQINGYSPQNFDEEYAGAVPAGEALTRSLNVPAVRMLKDYGLQKFYHKLEELQLSTLHYPASHYGLSIILGGSEVTLWDITGVYAGMARSLNHFARLNARYDPGDYHAPRFLKGDNDDPEQAKLQQHGLFSAASLWFTFGALTELHRPRQESGWKHLASSRKVAWKTGTSFGFRDAWAIGVTPRYAIGVWAGNADGEGRPGLTGVQAAAPILFDLLRTLPQGDWFEPPYDEMARVPVCRESGHRAGPHCSPVDTLFVPSAGRQTSPCPYHRRVHLDDQKQYQVNGRCADVYEMHRQSWFVLPPVMEWYYKQKHPEYKPLPPFAPGCQPQQTPVALIYPENGSRVFVPVNIDGEPGKLVFRATHRNDARIFWHLDERYIGTTESIHQMEYRPEPGQHTLHLVDERGNSVDCSFLVIEDN
jgi:penicillin-binding protein 1C